MPTQAGYVVTNVTIATCCVNVYPIIRMVCDVLHVWPITLLANRVNRDEKINLTAGVKRNTRCGIASIAMPD